MTQNTYKTTNCPILSLIKIIQLNIVTIFKIKVTQSKAI